MATIPSDTAPQPLRGTAAALLAVRGWAILTAAGVVSIVGAIVAGALRSHLVALVECSVVAAMTLMTAGMFVRSRVKSDLEVEAGYTASKLVARDHPELWQFDARTLTPIRPPAYRTNIWGIRIDEIPPDTFDVEHTGVFNVEGARTGARARPGSQAWEAPPSSR